MPPLPHSTYVSLTTFRRTGAPVATPAWAAPKGDALMVWTRADSGKVKRLRHTARVKAAPCDFCGRVEGPAVDGVTEFVDRGDWPRALGALRRTYGLRFTLGHTHVAAVAPPAAPPRPPPRTPAHLKPA